MCDLLIVCRLNTSCHLDCNTYRFLERQLSLFLNICLKSDSLYILHNDVVESLLASYIIDIDDVRMLQSCCGLSLSTKLCHKASIL